MEAYIDVLSKKKIVIENVPDLHKQVQAINLESIEKRTARERIQSVIEKFIVSALFPGNITNRRSYDFVRSRTTYLELTNYSIQDAFGYPVEATYLISDFSPPEHWHTEELDFSEGRLYINRPYYEEIRERLKGSIEKGYMGKRNEIGFAKVADVRDFVCRDLRISDDLFDDHIKRLYQEEPHWISFTYGGAADKVSEKRLPIVLNTPAREFFTYLRVNVPSA